MDLKVAQQCTYKIMIENKTLKDLACKKNFNFEKVSFCTKNAFQTLKRIFLNRKFIFRSKKYFLRIVGKLSHIKNYNVSTDERRLIRLK